VGFDQSPSEAHLRTRVEDRAAKRGNGWHDQNEEDQLNTSRNRTAASQGPTKAFFLRQKSFYWF
jgi:hypothetical protein